MAARHSRALLLLFGALVALTQTVFANVLAIDYGSDWIKASLMKPGLPFDVLLNKDSKRKIQASVAWKKDERLFGGDAANIASRFPQDSFSSLKLLQAAPYNSDAVQFYTSVSAAEVAETTRKTVELVRSDGTRWSTEELVAMQLSYVKDLAESLANEKVLDVVVTVPPFYSQFERDAVADAIEIAGMKTLALVNDGAAVAVNYAMTRSFPTPEYHVFYDAGASSIRATVASFTNVEGKTKSSPNSTHIAITGVGYDRNIGGTELDRHLRDLLVADFNKKHRKDIRENQRGMARLWKEASRVKTILSANAESRVTVESIAWDIDYKSTISRDQFEKACSNLQSRFAKPIVDAVASAGLTLDQISSVVMTGGASRTPMIKAAVTAVVGVDKIAVNVNADEAAVLGAALYGAGLSPQFRTKDIRVIDTTVHDVVAAYPAEKGTKTLSATIFPHGAKTGTRKTMSFKRKEDFALTLAYKQPPAPGFPTQLLEAHILGVAAAVKNLTDMGATETTVKATLALSESGFASVKEAVVVGEVKEDESFTDKLKGFFGASSSDSASESTTGTSSTSTSAAASASASDKVKKPVVKEVKVPLTIDVKFLDLPPMTVAEKRLARDRLRTLDLHESSKRAREDARNMLESYLYRLRDLLASEDDSSPFVKCSKDSERQEISTKLKDAFSWMSDYADDAETPKLVEQRRTLENLERPIVHRYKEIEEFPKALNQSQMWNWSTRLFLTDAKNNATLDEAEGLPAKYTTAELEELEETLIAHERWLNQGVEAQKKRQFNEDPAIDTKEMKRRAEDLAERLSKLARRKNPTKPKPKKSPTATSSSATPESSAAQSTPSASSKPAHEEL